MPFYPSYYPQEITLETMPPAAAPARFTNNTLHAYLGRDPWEGKTPSPGVTPVDSLGGWVVVTLNPAATVPGAEARCALAQRIVGGLTRDAAGFVRHAYAVTPYHADYLHHADLAEQATMAARARPAPGSPAPRLRARGRLAEALVGPRRAPAGGAWDALVEEIASDDVQAHSSVVNGSMGPPWLKEGWFQAWTLLAPAIRDPGERRRAENAFARVTAGAERPESRIAHERALLGALGAGCERVVAGYTVRREWLNADYSAGVENVAADAQAGLDSAMFVRTVKLKDFPWNGWLTLGLPERPTAAWNPVGGFTDAAGRLIWAAVGDAALFPEPYGNGWTDNRVRVEAVQTPAEPLTVPRDALLPEPGTGLLREVGEGTTARTKVTYQVLASAFHDGTRTSTADVLYAYAFAARWSGREGDPLVERATALARQALVGVKVLRVESTTLRFGEIAMQYEVPIVEVYLARGGLDPGQLAALAPPWSTVPWHALALMEEAVRRGVGAFSEEAARRRGVPWLDVVRDGRARDRLTALATDLEAQGHVPPALRRLVDEREARRRWGALVRFGAEHRHFLVTNGPYAVHAATPTGAVLRVVRDFSYPLGVGSWNRYPIPLRAFVTRAETRGDRLEVHLEVERLERFAREHTITVEPLPARFGQKDAGRPLCHYVALGPGGTVARAGTVRPTEPGVCLVGLGGLPRPATLLVTATLGGNHVQAPIKAVRVD
jgi:hypothetical protein